MGSVEREQTARQDYEWETRGDMYEWAFAGGAPWLTDLPPGQRSVVTIGQVLPASLDSERMCLVTILVSASLGFMTGVVAWGDTPGTRLSTVMAAPYPPKDTSSSVPRLPRGVFLSLLFTVVGLIKDRCALLPSHFFFASVLTLLCISAGAWLLAASALDSAAAANRKEHIEQFIASEPGNEPPIQPRFESFPAWLQLWEGINLAAHFLMVALVLYSVLTLSNS